MRWLVLPLFLALASLGGVAHADESDPEPQVASVEPFRAALVSNISLTAHAMSTMTAMSKHPAPKKMSAAQRKVYNEQTAWLKLSATRLHEVHVKMQQVLKKTAGATEIASINMEFVRVRDEIELQSHRYDALKARNTPALASLKHHDAPVLAALTR